MDNPNLKKVAVAVGILLSVFLLAKSIAEFKSLSYIGRTAPINNVISVTGKGEAIATPDVATFSFGVTEEAAIVGDAQKEATDKINKIIEYVKSNDVDDKDIKTTSYNIYPRYDYVKMDNVYGGKQVLGAYVVSQMIEIKVRKLENAGKLLSGIGEFGVTNVSGLSFTQDDENKFIREARDSAIKDARNQAEVLAKSLGVKLGKITSYYENQGGPIYYVKESMAYGMGGGDVRPPSVPSVPGGENKITSTVTITYEIK